MFYDKRLAQFKLACQNPSILADKEVLRLIAKQDNWLTMEQLRLACENPDILKNKKVLKSIAGQDSWQEMEQIRKSYGNSLKEVSDLVIKQVALGEIEQSHNNIFKKIKNLKKDSYQAKKLILGSIKNANEMLQQDIVMDLENDIDILKCNAIRNIEYTPLLERKKDN